ncbi:hypothetical protein HELRODRAFT_171763 [Helobdella robusta]|uniref:Uncharacterized protein n=1 Tax=Helobdella robusta TaxID=6412 RepID=T1F4M3_HELRO|nr:hypothetical protein HELRODRAFT_171763 [Helobdella robusta]ESO05371.1 hypothetical protein HELRODRAFT_171763 [Helobdella robusta]
MPNLNEDDDVEEELTKPSITVNSSRFIKEHPVLDCIQQVARTGDCKGLLAPPPKCLTVSSEKFFKGLLIQALMLPTKKPVGSFKVFDDTFKRPQPISKSDLRDDQHPNKQQESTTIFPPQILRLYSCSRYHKKNGYYSKVHKTNESTNILNDRHFMFFNDSQPSRQNRWSDGEEHSKDDESIAVDFDNKNTDFDVKNNSTNDTVFVWESDHEHASISLIWLMHEDEETLSGHEFIYFT